MTLVSILSLLNAGVCREIFVGQGSSITSIAKGIEISNSGDEIIVGEGIYHEGNLIINKSLRLTGKSAVIDLDYTNAGFIIECDSITISGFEIRNINVNYMKDLAGIRIQNSNYCLIENNFLNNTFFAIYLANSNHCTIRNNKIAGNAVTESSSGNGIHLWKCNGNVIINNEVNGHRDGIYFEFVKNTIVNENFSHNNLRYGLHFMFSDSNSYRNNFFRQNGAGVAVMYTRRIEMSGNRFEENRGPASYGLLLKEISDSKIVQNIIKDNTTGIFMEGCNNLYIGKNTFLENGWAMKILGNCLGNTLEENDFKENTFDVMTNSSRNDNYYNRNYWDKYEGYDIDKDDIGDVPYRPVSMYSFMVEKIPESVIMLRSLVVEILDITEKVMPALIPETLIDEHPMMKANEFN